MCSAALIATWEHIFFSVLHALHAFIQKRNISNQLSLEILLYISGQRQIKVALEKFGVKAGDDVVIILGNSEASVKQALEECEILLGGARSDEVMMIFNDFKQSEICKYYQIGNDEISAISLTNNENQRDEAIFKAILNRIALVSLEK